MDDDYCKSMSQQWVVEIPQSAVGACQGHADLVTVMNWFTKCSAPHNRPLYRKQADETLAMRKNQAGRILIGNTRRRVSAVFSVFSSNTLKQSNLACNGISNTYYPQIGNRSIAGIGAKNSVCSQS